MPANPLLQSIKSAVSMNERLAGMFEQAGNITEGRGYVVRAYRNANRAMPAALQEDNQRSAVRDVMIELRTNLRAELRTSLEASFGAGMDESARQLRFYGVETRPNVNPINLTKQVETAVDAVLAQVDAQETTINAMLASGIDTVLITGDEERQGVLKPAEILTGATYWIAALVWDSFSWWSQSNGGGYGWQKQSIAALDGRTTDCCLRAHGQIVPLRDRFVLTGTPRFADRLEWTPFHWRCRTSIVLYLAQFDEGLTEKMRSAAGWLLDQRAKGRKPDQHPADAFWN